MRVRLTREAEADLERIGDFIARGAPQRALTFIGELREKCLTLADAPDAFPLVSRYRQSGVRRRIYGNYLIFYAVEGADILVLHVLHGAMDYESILFPDADVELLEVWLMRRSKGITDIVELEGFLTAVVIGPVTLMPSRWLPKVFGGQSPGFRTDEEFSGFVRLVMGFYNDIVLWFQGDPAHFQPTFHERRID